MQVRKALHNQLNNEYMNSKGKLKKTKKYKSINQMMDYCYDMKKKTSRSKSKLGNYTYRYTQTNKVVLKENKNSNSKSFEKVSPLKKKKHAMESKMLYTSPISKSKKKYRQSTSKSPLNDITSNKRINSQREQDKMSHGLSTKIYTQRSPISYKNRKPKTKKHVTEVSCHQHTQKQKHKSSKVKNQRSEEKQKRIKAKSKRQKASKPQKNESIKPKKIKLQIKTQQPRKKQSYFDVIMQSARDYPRQMLDSEGFSQWDKNKSTLQTLNAKNYITNNRVHPYVSNMTDGSKEADYKYQLSKKQDSSFNYENIRKQQQKNVNEIVDKYKERLRSVSLREVESFRKQQELKWKIISLELSNIKKPNELNNQNDSQIHNKLEQIVIESLNNISEFQTKTKQINDNAKFLQTSYVMMQSPKIVQAALRQNKHDKHKKEEAIELVKNMSNKKLLQEIQMIEDHENTDTYLFQQFYSSKCKQQLQNDIKHPKQKSQEQSLEGTNFNFQSGEEALKNDKQPLSSIQSNSRSFCLQFQKQLESYVSENHEQKNRFKNQVSGPPLPFLEMEVEKIDEAAYQKNQRLCNQIQNYLLFQLCNEMLESEYILNSFLVYMKINKQSTQIIQTSNSYILLLVRGLFKFLLSSENIDQLQEMMNNLNTPFGNSPQLCLKWIRYSIIPDYSDQDDIFEFQNSPQPILTLETLSQYDMNTYMIESQSQYFFHHCIYSCLNQLMDKHRPYGRCGKPPLIKNVPQSMYIQPSKIYQFFAKIEFELEQLVSTMIGREDFTNKDNAPQGNKQYGEWQMAQIYRQVEVALKKMDKFLIEDDGRFAGFNNDMQSCQEFLFQNKIFLAHAIQEYIVNQQVLMIFNDFQ